MILIGIKIFLFSRLDISPNNYNHQPYCLKKTAANEAQQSLRLIKMYRQEIENFVM